MVIFTQQDVAPWAELSFSYSGVSDEDIAASIILSMLHSMTNNVRYSNRLQIEQMKAQFMLNVVAERRDVEA